MQKSLVILAVSVSSAAVFACSKKEPCGPATAPAYAQEYVLGGGEVCKASEGGGGVTLSINYANLEEVALQDQYSKAMTAKGYKLQGKNGMFIVTTPTGSNVITTMADKKRGGALAIVKVFPPAK